MTAGYSGTPLTTKLGLKSPMRMAVVESPSDYPAIVGALPPGVSCTDVVDRTTDLVHLFATKRAALSRHLAGLRKKLREDAAIWVSWPKKAARVPTDLTEDTIRDVALPLGFVDIKVCAVSAVWSGLKLVVRKELRSGGAVRAAPRARPKLLAGGNPQVAKADGDAPVQAYLAAIPGWRRDIARRFDDLVGRTVPAVRRGVRWNSPMYGIEGQGWFASSHVFTGFVKITFFKGTSLRPIPPGGSAQEARWVNVAEDGFDEALLTGWIRQAASMPGWGGR